MNQTSETQLPNSQRIYVKGAQPGVVVPFREITQNITKSFNGATEVNEVVALLYSLKGEVLRVCAQQGRNTAKDGTGWRRNLWR